MAIPPFAVSLPTVAAVRDPARRNPLWDNRMEGLSHSIYGLTPTST